MVKIFAKWIPAGHADSKFNADGSRKEAAAPIKVPAKS
jgi:hypothetical protein